MYVQISFFKKYGELRPRSLFSYDSANQYYLEPLRSNVFMVS